MENTINVEKRNKRSNLMANNNDSKKIIFSLIMNYGLLFVVLILFALFSVIEFRFCSINNIFEILYETSVLSILALGLTFVVIVGEFDISLVHSSALAGVMAILLIMNGVNMFLVFLIPIITLFILSYLKGKAMEKLGIPSFIVTLGFMVSLQGLLRHLTKGITIFPQNVPETFLILGRFKFFGKIHILILFFLIIFLASVLFFDHSKIGRHIYAVGGDLEVSLFVGLPVSKLKTMVFIISGFLFCFEGFILASSMGAARMTMGHEYMMSAITATFLGEIFLMRGIPNVKGTVVSALLLTVLSNGFSAIGLPFYFKQSIQGMILLTTLAILYLRIEKAKKINQKEI